MLIAPTRCQHHDNMQISHILLVTIIQISQFLLLNIQNYSPKKTLFIEVSAELNNFLRVNNFKYSTGKGMVFVLSYRKLFGDITCMYGIHYTQQQETFDKKFV